MPAKRTNSSKYQWDQTAVQSLRKHLGSTQGELAEELGVRQQTVSEWETGLYQPRGASVTLLSIVAERADFHYTVGSSKGSAAPGEPSDAPP